MFFSTNESTFKNEVKEFIPASVATSRGKLWPFIEQADRKYIKPLLQDELYSELQAYYNDPVNGGSGSGEDRLRTKEVLKLVQLSAINLAYYIGFDVLNAKLSDGGFKTMETDTFKGLYKYQEANLRDYFKDTGFNTIDDILEFLEKYIEHFPEWEESSNYTIRKKSIIPNTLAFNNIVYISGSRLIFLRLQQYIQYVLDLKLKPVLGKTLWDKFQTELSKDAPGSKYIALRSQIQKPLAFLSAAELISNSGSITEKGLYFEGKNSGFPDNTTLNVASNDKIAIVASNYRLTGESYLEALQQYLAANDFDDYSGMTGSVFNRDNDDKKTFWT